MPPGTALSTKRDIATSRRRSGAPAQTRCQPAYSGRRMTNAPENHVTTSSDRSDLDDLADRDLGIDLGDALDATAGWDDEDDPEQTTGDMDLAARHALRRVVGLSTEL